jgi:plastocyanin
MSNERSINMKQTLFFLSIFALVFCNSATCIAQEKIIDARGNPSRWVPKEITVRAGDVLIWRVTQGTHGVIFNDFDTAKTALTIDEQASLPIGAQEGFPPPAQGTQSHSGSSSAPFILVRATVKNEIPPGMTEISFVCTRHPENMDGKVIIQTNPTATPTATLTATSTATPTATPPPTPTPTATPSNPNPSNGTASPAGSVKSK